MYERPAGFSSYQTNPSFHVQARSNQRKPIALSNETATLPNSAGSPICHTLSLWDDLPPRESLLHLWSNKRSFLDTFFFSLTQNSKNRPAAATACHRGKRKVCGLKAKVGRKWVVPLKVAKWTLGTSQRRPQSHQNRENYVNHGCYNSSNPQPEAHGY